MLGACVRIARHSSCIRSALLSSSSNSSSNSNSNSRSHRKPRSLSGARAMSAPAEAQAGEEPPAKRPKPSEPSSGDEDEGKRLNVDVRPESYETELATKVERVRALFTDLPAGSGLPAELDVYASRKDHFRARAEFRVWHDGDDMYYAMFDPRAPRTPVRIDHYPMGSERLCELMPLVLEGCKAVPELRHKLFQVNFLTTLAGDALVTLIYHKQLKDTWKTEAEAFRQRLGVKLIGRARKQKVILGSEFVEETLKVDGRDLHYRQIEGAFSQPNPGMAQNMLSWARVVSAEGAGTATLGVEGRPSSEQEELAEGATWRAAPAEDDLVEMYCGNANFTIALASLYRGCFATEISKVLIRMAQHNVERNNVTNIHLGRMSAEEFTSALDGTQTFDRLKDVPLSDMKLRTVLVDPPRAGLGPEVSEFLRRFDRIIYISCNPSTMRTDFDTIGVGPDYEVRRFAVFDQFPYTSHVESGAYLVRRAAVSAE
mmetsp:Transcript_25284/g.83048  ORF Transcript_25284/g.83048 Transcript_25284/m.83048 type:complete len:486 (+) Transcript_25284:1483-2940(+)